jgi:uncharacterized protein
MPIAVICPSCKAKLKAPEALIGKKVKCPGCAALVLVKAAAVLSTPVGVTAAAKPAAKKKTPPPEILDDDPVEEVLEDEDEEIEARPKKKGKRDLRPAKTGDSTDSERTMALFIHIGSHIVNLVAGGLGIFVPIILWVMKRKDSRFIDHHGKTWLNFAINLFVISLGLLLVFGLLGALIGVVAGWGWAMIAFVLLMIALVGLGIYGLVMNIVAGLKAKKGEWYEYRVLFKVLK